ncbi:hypothetical protein BDU57DRAFT_233757 [Ampelomyces quisqualis]|uniref:Uncharacterized protein n=1 Tax=Ampelomyces quisqualis TaxID=50730 RepID=A0A6A5QPM3_AMPQU|nr:hypothetical protein BDU57DRAFT_233757 [Ampelomyces quisqualis]
MVSAWSFSASSHTTRSILLQAFASSQCQLHRTVRSHSLLHPQNSICRAWLNETREKNMYRTKVQGVTDLGSFTMIQMPFAIIFGGKADAQWAEIVILLDPADADNDFHALLAADKWLVQSCATNSHRC